MKYLYNIIATAVVINISVLFFHQKSKTEHYERKYNSSLISKDKCKTNKEFVEDMFLETIKYDEICIYDFIELNIDSGNQIDAMDLFDNKNYLVFAFSNKTCQSCRSLIMKEIARVIGLRSDNLCFLGFNCSINELEVFNKQYYNLKKIHKINKLLIEDKGSPKDYLFVIDSKGKIRNLYIPINENLAMTSEYLKLIKLKYNL